MREFETVSLKEARIRTIPGRQGRFLNEYAAYIQQLPQGQTGKIHVLEQENPLTVRRRLQAAATALGTKLIIKRSGEDVYFWSEDREDEQPRTKRGRQRRPQEETAAEQYFSETGELDQGEIRQSA